MKFGLNAVVSGKRNVASNNEPVIIANSTKAKFTLTGVVTRVMNIIPGDFVQFINNIAAIENAILENDPELVSFVAEQGLEWGTNEAREAILKEYSVWAVCKGIAMLDKEGNPRQVVIRQTEEQKKALLELQFEELLQEKHDLLVARAINKDIVETEEDATDEILATLLTIDDVNAPTTDEFSGSKTATTSNMIGLGLTVSFSDSNIWNELKADLEDAEKVNRYFTINLEEPIEVEIPNGKGMVPVKAYQFKFDRDEEPVARVGKK